MPTSTTSTDVSVSSSQQPQQPQQPQQQQLIPAVETIVDDSHEVKKRRLEDRIDLFNPENPDAIETLVLILKSQLPAKVAEVTPLTELYYLAQTLPLAKLMPTTHKIITSKMYETVLTEGKVNVVYNRIEELKRYGKWSLIQPTRYVDPYRVNHKGHWDNLLSEMNWMATDFKEERKLKIATCAMIASCIEDYWKYGKVCCVKRKPIKLLEAPVEETETLDTTAEATPVVDEDVVMKSSEPQAIDVSLLLKRVDASAEINPPLLPETTQEEYARAKEEEGYTPFKLFLDTNDIRPQDKTLLEAVPTFSSFQSYDTSIETPLVPISKSLVNSNDETWYNLYLKQTEDSSNIVPAQQRGLFGVSSSRRPTSSIKPPPPPNLKYLDLRTPTIWLPEDDRALIDYVNMFSFNWGVVSAHLSKRPTRSYQSNIERRTPWQCFERYIQLNDTFQIQDMRGQNSLTSSKWLEHAHHIQATTKRRISPLGVGPESIQRGHKRLRWASMFEAIRKCMRKREAITRPNPNQTRKNLEEKKLDTPTPAQLSQLKYNRDKSNQEAYLQNTANQQRARNANAGNATANATAAARAASGNGTNGQQRPGGTPTPQVAQQVAQGQAIKRPNSVPAQGIPKGVGAATAASIAQAKPSVGVNGTPYTPEQLQQLMQLKQRKLAQQAAVANAGGNGLNAPLAAQMRSNSNPVQGTQGAGSPVPLSQGVGNGGMKPLSTGNSAQPSKNVNGITQFSSAQVAAMIQHIQAKNPNISKDEVTKIATQYLANLQQKAAQNASANAAAAASSNNNGGAVNDNNIQPRSGANTPRASQSPMVQAKPIASGVPTPGQILQQQSSMTPPMASPPNRVLSAGPQPQQGAGSPIQGLPQVQQLTPQQQKAQIEMMKALQTDQQQGMRRGNGNESASQ